MTTFTSSQSYNANIPATLSTPAPNPPNPLAAVGSLNKYSPPPLNSNNTRSIVSLPPQSPLSMIQQNSNISVSQVMIPSTSVQESFTPISVKKPSAYKSRSSTAKSLFGGAQTPQAVHEVVAAIGSSLTPKSSNILPNDIKSGIKASQFVSDISTLSSFTTTSVTSKFDISEDGMCTPGESKLERLTKAWIREYCIAETGAFSSRGDM